MYVKDHMTPNPVTITPDTPVSKAVELMKKGNFHRLPVVNAEGKLLGLITEGIVTEGTGANSTSLDIYELNYLLNRTKVEDIMIKGDKVVTISPDVFLEEAAEKMGSINVLPVVDEKGKVIGVITEKDIFKAFLELLGYRKQGTRFVINMVDVPGGLTKAAQLFSDNDANVTNLAVYHTEERGTELVIKATGEISVENMTKILMDNGFHVTNIVQTKDDGTMVKD